MATTTTSDSPRAGTGAARAPRAGTSAARAPRNGTGTKRRILDAAEQVVLRDGVGHLTLEASAAQAGLSKGGVLYHFPTRDALVSAMVARIIEQFEEDIEAYLPPEGSPERARPGAFTRAYVRATMEPVTEGEERLGAALLAAAAAEPELLEPLQRAADGWQSRLVADGLDPSTATVVRLACDGLWLCDLFGLASPRGALRARVADALESMTGDAP